MKRETLGELIASRLLELGWSNAELARRTGFSTTYIGNLARDVSPGTKTGRPKRLPDDTVERIARALSIPIDRARRAAGLAEKDRHTPETIEAALDSADFFDQKDISEEARKALRPLLESADRMIDLLKARDIEIRKLDKMDDLKDLGVPHAVREREDN